MDFRDEEVVDKNGGDDDDARKKAEMADRLFVDMTLVKDGQEPIFYTKATVLLAIKREKALNGGGT